jgi:hypothetical protein
MTSGQVDPATRSRPCAKRLRSSSTRRKVPQQLIVVGMRANPEPDDLVRVAHPEGTVGESDPHRVDRTTGVHELEAKARM